MNVRLSFCYVHSRKSSTLNSWPLDSVDTSPVTCLVEGPTGRDSSSSNSLFSAICQWIVHTHTPTSYRRHNFCSLRTSPISHGLLFARNCRRIILFLVQAFQKLPSKFKRLNRKVCQWSMRNKCRVVWSEARSVYLVRDVCDQIISQVVISFPDWINFTRHYGIPGEKNDSDLATVL
jgi:hypothetical protein